MKFSNLAALAGANAHAALYTAGTTNPTSRLILYSGPEPTNADDALIGSNVVLAVVELDATPWSAAVDADPGATISLNAVPLTDLAADANGTATFALGVDRDENVIDLFSVGSDLILNSATIAVGVPFDINSGFITFRES